MHPPVDVAARRVLEAAADRGEIAGAAVLACRLL
jgi:hypothetical protein